MGTLAPRRGAVGSTNAEAELTPSRIIVPVAPMVRHVNVRVELERLFRTCAVVAKVYQARVSAIVLFMPILERNKKDAPCTQCPTIVTR